MVFVPKKSGSVGISVDLNESVLRKVHPIPKMDDTLALMTVAKIFSKLDANSWFWQIPLAKQSKLLTTFVTPFGRYCFNKVPFGISSAPELFQRRMNQILEGLPGVLCLIDDVFVLKILKMNMMQLLATLKRIQQAGGTLNTSKYAFRQRSVDFLGHLIDEHGVRADPQPISRMDPPKSISDLQRFLGMVNQHGKFSAQISNLTKPLQAHLSSKNMWVWGPEQEQAFSLIKEELVKPTVLALYDPEATTKVSADA